MTSFAGAFDRLDALRRPQGHARNAEPLFDVTRAPALRPAIVVATDEMLDEESGEKQGYLLGLLGQDCFELHRYRDEGPPAASIRTSEHDHELQVAPGWAMYRTGTDPRTGGSVIYFRDGREQQIWAQDPDFTQFGVEQGTKLYDGDRDRAQRDVIAATVAASVRADVVITSRPLLRKTRLLALHDSVALDVDEALPLIGLYLRVQGRYIVNVSPPGKWPLACSRGLFYWVAARELLPSGWRWRSRCCAAEQGNPLGALGRLTETCHQRVGRMLRARDQLHVVLLGPQSRDRADDALVALEAILLNMMAAFDTAARVAHGVLSLDPSTTYTAGWQNKSWRKLLDRAGASDLSKIVQPKKKAWATIEVVRRLRNTVHAQALSPLGSSTSSRRQPSFTVLLPLDPSDQEELLSSVRILGDPQAWGFAEPRAGRHPIEMRRFAEALVPEFISALDDLIAATPVERLGAFPSTDVEDHAPTDDDAFRPEHRQRIRWQLGL